MGLYDVSEVLLSTGLDMQTYSSTEKPYVQHNEAFHGTFKAKRRFLQLCRDVTLLR